MIRTTHVYRESIKKIDNEKKVTAIITLITIFLIYLFLNILNVPANRKTYMDLPEIDLLFEKFRPETKIIIPTLKLDPNKISPKATLPSTESLTPKPTVPDLKDQMDQLFRPVETPDFKVDRNFTPDQKNPEILLAENNELDIERLIPRSESDFTNPKNLIRVPSVNSRNQDIKVTQSNSKVNYQRTGYANDDTDHHNVIKSKSETKKRVIQIIPVTEIPKMKADIPQILRKLSEWMRKNPAALPDAAKKFMEFKTNDLTSRVVFEIDGRVFEIFLLCVENIYQVKICLIEGKQTTLLKDQGFIQTSHFLRTGTVHRTKNEILAFGTEQKPASKNETQEFYQIFLSWWKSTGMDDN